MIDFIGRMEMAFIATSDAAGECDCSFRAGKAGFIRVLDERTIAYPELRGNGVMASLGNIVENPHVGIFMIDFAQDLIGLHVNGTAEIVTPEYMHDLCESSPEEPAASGHCSGWSCASARRTSTARSTSPSWCRNPASGTGAQTTRATRGATSSGSPH